MIPLETLMTVLSFQLRIPIVDLKTVEVDPEALARVPEEFARQQVAVESEHVSQLQMLLVESPVGDQ